MLTATPFEARPCLRNSVIVSLVPRISHNETVYMAGNAKGMYLPILLLHRTLHGDALILDGLDWELPRRSASSQRITVC